jgi:hypothetical protein
VVLFVSVATLRGDVSFDCATVDNNGLAEFKIGAVFVSDNGVCTNKRAFEQPILYVYEFVCSIKKCLSNPDHKTHAYK